MVGLGPFRIQCELELLVPVELIASFRERIIPITCTG
ncbi:hypothetical protein SY89_03188 [Halolamina pelagica]|uniref:Uncharacterized protein n=1 Tax=Halolamina pelagica TaxID=699431 RepID=A0A0P7HX38_9EURY|nr:hypothetical protein SY89_03188 [Halolamina pelagica]